MDFVLIDKYTPNELEEFKTILENKVFFHKELTKKSIVYEKIVSYFSPNDTLYISLSGGVDSMVLISVLKEFCKVVAIHINYNNRSEASKEQEFIEKWCENYNIPIKILLMDITRTCVDRNMYEKYTNKKRFEFYKQYTNEILLGHHKNDIVENTLSNIMACKNLFDIHNMNFESINHDIIVKRPLINLYKKDILDYAHEHNIPYFKDTTPSWSVRGQLRNNIFSTLKIVYNNYENAFHNHAMECNAWKTIVNDKIIFPMASKVKIKGKQDQIQLIIPLPTLMENNHIVIWKRFFTYVIHDIGMSMISNKSILEIHQSFNKNHSIKRRSLSKNAHVECDEEIMTLTFKIN